MDNKDFEIICMLEDFQYDCFKSLLKTQMSIKFYMCVFYATFLGPEKFPTTETEFNKIYTSENDDKFIEYCRGIIDQTDLSETENKFFYAITYIQDPNNFINNCIDSYESIANSYQLKPLANIMRCLQASKDIEFK